tara:strand:+ start:31 stop:633 length:603 start_codon:yes stop_codon:yes gene_type:complete
MKKLLLILLSISLFSCNNNYKEAEELYLQGIEEKSQFILNSAVLKLDMIKEHHKDFNQAKLLNNKIDSIKNYWLIVWEEKIQKELDSINKINAAKLESLKITENKMYPLLIGRWVLNSSSYSSLNSIVRIYKKNGVYFQSMLFEKDNSESVLKLTKKSNKRFNVDGKSDYCLITKEGDLQFWDKQGYFLSCDKINLEDID